MKKKAKRYDEGGGVREGQNAGIDDDTRARAMKWLQQQQESQAETESAAPKAKPTRKAMSTTDTGDESDRLSRRYAQAKPAVFRRGTPEDIPGSAPAGWRGGSGERADSTELGRNVSAAMNAMGPGRIATGLSLAAREAAAANAAQKAYNARAAARRAEEGLNATEAAAAKQAIRERKTLNPLSWLSGPKGMENFKKGGVVKKASSASRRGDGIASKGKTRGRFV